MPWNDRTGWVVAADATGAGSPGNVIDGNTATYWRPTNFGQPHWLTFDMLTDQPVSTISLLTLSPTNTDAVGNISMFVSTDGITWGSAVETTSFINTTPFPDYWFLSTTYSTRYFKLLMSSLNGAGLQINDINAGTLISYQLLRPTAYTIDTGTCGDGVFNPQFAIDAEPGVPPAPPTTFAGVEQATCGAFSSPASLILSYFPTTPINPTNQFALLTIWTELLTANSSTYVLVKYDGEDIDFGLAGIPPSSTYGGPYTLRKTSWIIPGVSNPSLLTIEFSMSHSAGGLVSPNTLLVYDCYVEIGFFTQPAPVLNARVLPYLIIPAGQGQSIDEINGQSSISTMTVECIDPSNELKYLATKTEVVGKNVYFKMGFEGMRLSDFIPLHTMQISDNGRTNDGKMRFECRDSLAVLDRALWFCGGPQPVALPWLYGQAYTAGQYIMDSNGNIELCIQSGVTSSTQPPIWPGTPAPEWAPNTSYTLNYWATDTFGNLQAVTTVPSGHTSTRPLNTGVSGNGFPIPSWSNTLGGITNDNSGGNPNGPLTWTCIAINDELGLNVTDNTVIWQIVAKPYQGAFGGSQAFYVYSIYGDTGQQVPQPPPSYAFTSNQYPTLDTNPRYVYGNPIDVLLVALQNELGVGQNPNLPPIVTTDPNNPQNALVFAPNPLWQQYIPGNDSTLINPNPFLDLDSIIFVRDNQCSGRRLEWAIKRPVTAKQWIESEIMHPFGLYLFVGADGRLGIHSMRPPNNPVETIIDSNSIDGTPDEERLPIVNVVTVRCDVNDEGAYSAARIYDAEMTFAQQRSLATYLQEFSHSCESTGLRLAYDSYGVAYLLADRIFRRHGFGTPQYTIKCHLGEIRLELGDYILLSHPLMMDYMSSTGQLGITNVLCQIMDKQPNYADGGVTFKVYDCRFMKLSQPYQIAPLASAIPVWTSATSAEKLQFMFVSYFPGYYFGQEDGNTIF